MFGAWSGRGCLLVAGFCSSRAPGQGASLAAAACMFVASRGEQQGESRRRWEMGSLDDSPLASATSALDP